MALLGASLFAASLTHGAQRDLDPSFGAGGKVVTGFFPSVSYEESRATSIALQSKGRIVAAGQAYGGGPERPSAYRWALGRYRSDGRLDRSFSGDGKLMIRFDNEYSDAVFDLAVQPDGKLIAVGNGNGFTAVRLKENGELDRSFAKRGKATAGLGTARSVALQPNGKIVLAGSGLGGNGFALARYQRDGTLDSSFGAEISGSGSTGRTGVVLTTFGDVGEGDDLVAGLALQPDGKIVVAGTANISDEGYGDLALARYNPDGSLDSTFSDDGKVAFDSSDGSLIDMTREVAIRRDGRILVSGTGGGRFAVVRLLPDGSLDPSFSEDGRAQLFSGEANEIIQLEDGRILAAGSSREFALVALTPDGELDASYSQNGVAGVRFFRKDARFPGGQEALGMALQRDGRVVLAGGAELPNSGSDERFALARFEAP